MANLKTKCDDCENSKELNRLCDICFNKLIKNNRVNYSVFYYSKSP